MSEYKTTGAIKLPPKLTPEQENRVRELLNEVFDIIGYIKAKELLADIFLERTRDAQMAKRR